MDCFSWLHFLSVTVALTGLAHAPQPGRGPAPDWERARELVSRVQQNLRRLGRAESFSGPDRERYIQAVRDLSEMDRGLANGRFDPGRLDQAIQHIDALTRSTSVDPRERDVLLDDLRDLHRLREDWR